MRIIAVANQKGGCGKTTTTINLGASLAFLHKKILLVDLDPQAHTTCGLGLRPEALPSHIYHWLSPREDLTRDPGQILRKIDSSLFLIPSASALSAVEEELANTPRREKRLKDMLESLKLDELRLDYVLIDCPPHLGILTLNALEAADEILIPMEPSFFSLHGLAKMSETLEWANARRLVPLRVHALLTLFDSRTCFAKEVYEEVQRHFKEKLFRTIIHDSVLLKEASSAGQAIVRYAHESPACKEYLNLAVEYLAREWERLLPEKNLGWDSVLKRRYGPRRVTGGTLFQAVAKKARWVEIAGDFNHWVPEPMVRRSEEDLWQKIIPIPAGRHRYKLIVDGEWQIDPYQPLQQMNPYGSFDSCLEVA